MARNKEVLPPRYVDVYKAFVEETGDNYVGLCQQGVDIEKTAQCREHLSRFLDSIGIVHVDGLIKVADPKKYLVAKIRYNF